MHRSARAARRPEANRRRRDCTGRTTAPDAAEGRDGAKLRPGKRENRSIGRQLRRFRRVAFQQRAGRDATGNVKVSSARSASRSSDSRSESATLSPMSKIYTRTGDDGETALYGGGRVRKDDLRVAAFGTVDELNAVLGLVRAELRRIQPPPANLDQFVERAQHQLFNLGAELATLEPVSKGTNLIQDSDVTALEAAIDGWEAQLEPLREFILPGGSAAAAQFHLARAVCRRAERLLVTLSAEAALRGEPIRYLNRLSDALFVAARSANRAAGVADVKWRPRP
jgi:cob(I)alamin adenosyltransferase